jgi:hypothetical protein
VNITPLDRLTTQSPPEYSFEVILYTEARKFQPGTEVQFTPGENRQATEVLILESERVLLEKFAELKQRMWLLKALGEQTPELDNYIRSFVEGSLCVHKMNATISVEHSFTPVSTICIKPLPPEKNVIFGHTKS